MPNKHTESTWINDINNRKCPKRNCKGTLIHYLIRNVPRGPVVNEYECSDCGLIKKGYQGKKNNGKYSTTKAGLSKR